ncbi:unnamed protein product, partial [Trichobilharzia regenti]
ICANSSNNNAPIKDVVRPKIDFISTLVLKCPKLEALNLSHCVSVCDSRIKIISERLHNLCRLNLDGIQQLWISFCDNIEDTTVVSIVNLSNLTSLTVRKTQVTPNALSSLFVCQTADDLNRNLILKYLEYLDLSEALGVNDTVVLDMCSCCGNRRRSLSYPYWH